MSDAPQLIQVVVEDGVATLRLNRPEKLNAFTHAMVEQWADELDELAMDDAVRVILVTGAGKAFCAGGDAEEMAMRGKLDALARKDYLWKHVHRIALAMERMDKPVIAAVNGTARGAGCDMALMCDLRIAARSAVFAESYINMGLIAGDGGSYYLPRLVGTARALEIFWTGREVRADEAERIGMVNRVVDDAALMDEARALAAQIAAQPQLAVRYFKRAVYQGLSMPLAANLDMISSHMSVLRDTDDHRAKLQGFLARRQLSAQA
jgi:enoyl-CoA hydratase/carnithine racemase